MSLKKTINGVLSLADLELHRRPDPTIPNLHSIQIEEKNRKLWIANTSTKSWWQKPAMELNGELLELKRLCSAGDRVLEIGAHHGLMTLLMSDWVGDAGRIFAIEASAENALVLAANCFENQTKNVSTSHLALSDTVGTATFSGESLAASTGIVRTVPMTTTDCFCAEAESGTIDLLKIDVEGFELQVLKGASELLKHRPKLALELHVDLLPEAGSSASEVWQFLESVSMLNERTITYVSRPNWNDVQTVTQFNQLPTSGVVNIFVM